MLQTMTPNMADNAVQPLLLSQFHPSELLPTPEELISNQYILSEPLDPNAIVNPRSSWMASLTADIKPTKERRKVKIEPNLDKLKPGAPSITSKSVIRAVMNERVKKLDMLQQVDESIMDPSIASKHRKEKIRLLTLERSRRAAQLRRIKKKNYVKNLEGRIGMMAKHLEKLEVENNQLRLMVTKWTQAEAAGERLPTVTTDTLSAMLPIVSDIGPVVSDIGPAMNLKGKNCTIVKADPDVVDLGPWAKPIDDLSVFPPQLDIPIPTLDPPCDSVLPIDYLSPMVGIGGASSDPSTYNTGQLDQLGSDPSTHNTDQLGTVGDLP